MATEASYQNQLLTTAQQLDVLRGYNRDHWEGHFSDADLAALDVSYEYPTPDNMPVIHAEFGSPWGTYEAWRRVYISSEMSHLNELVPRSEKDFDSYMRLHEQTVRYNPGLHIVRMDLTRNRDTYRTMDEAYSAAEETPGLFLAHGEALSLMGLHRALRAPDGYGQRNMPYLPGYRTRNIFVPEAQAKEWNWTVRFDPGNMAGWGLRAFPTKGTATIAGAVLLVRSNEDSA